MSKDTEKIDQAEPSLARGESRATYEGEVMGEGSTSSNTDPSDTKTKLYRHGIDSLYLSSRGELKAKYIDLLEEKKKAAQSEDISVSGTAQIEISGHFFEVKDKGGRGFAFVLEDNAFRISVNKSQKNKMPMAYAIISSECLTLCGVVAAVEDLKKVLAELGQLHPELTISRVDLCVDFSTTFDFEELRSDDFVTKCEDFATFEKKPELTGMTAGMGGDISFRLYNKTVELKKKPRPYLEDLWKTAGWDGQKDVWRAEFQVRREAVMGMNIITVNSLIRLDASLWSYLTKEWLRIVIKNPNDSHRDRWLSQPFWESLSTAFGTEEIYPLAERFKNDRAPEEENIFRRFASVVASYVAIKGRGVISLHDTVYRLISEANDCIVRVSRQSDTLSSSIAKRAAEKCKKYNLPQLSGEVVVNDDFPF